MKFKDSLGFILIVGGLIGMIACVIAEIVFRLQNVDMTEMRLLIEYPYPSIGCIICFIGIYFGKYLLLR